MGSIDVNTLVLGAVCGGVAVAFTRASRIGRVPMGMGVGLVTALILTILQDLI